VNPTIVGRARVLPDRVNTDYIISSTRKKDTIDPSQLKRWLLEAVDLNFARTVKPGDILVAGQAFGCGSAMEVAVTVVTAAGIKAVLARSFSRTYYRNAINNGLMPIVCDTSTISEGDELSLSLCHDRVVITNRTSEAELTAAAFPSFILKILSAGGLVPYLREHGRFPEENE